MWTYKQHSDGHERSSSGGYGAVHEDNVVFTDVFWQTKVVKLERKEMNNFTTTTIPVSVTS